MAPHLDQLLVFENAQGISVTDVEFRHAGAGDRVNTYFPPSDLAAIVLSHSHGVKFERVSVSDCGGSGWSMQTNVSRVTIVNCSATDLGGEGISITQSEGVADISITDSVVNNTALVYLGQPGSIVLRGERNITVERNNVSFSPYAGIKVGWQQEGYDAAHGSIGTVTPIFNVAFNRVSDYGLGVLSDFGGIYISSDDNLCFQRTPQTCYLPTRVHGNEISRCDHYNYGCEGVYMDEQVSGVDITNNVIFDLEDAGLYFHCGSGNRGDANVIAGCKVGLGGCNAGGNPTWPNLPHGFNFTRNIVYLDPKTALLERYSPDFRDTVFDDNVYWSPDPDTLNALQFPNKTDWVAWRATGHDTHSIRADPMFVDAAGHDFRLRPGSPASALGIPQPDQASAGSKDTPLPARGIFATQLH